MFDEDHEIAKANGALGGKISGAAAPFLFYVEEQARFRTR
jgi:hypothetical protein